MYTLVVAGLFGAYVASRRAPRSKHKKHSALGTVTGSEYQVEYFPEPGFVIVYAKDGSVGTFQKQDGGGFLYLRGSGMKSTVMGMKDDFERGLKPG